MAERTVKVCDVCGRQRQKPIESFQVDVLRQIEGGSYETTGVIARDLCEKCLERLKRFLDRGVSKPKGGS